MGQVYFIEQQCEYDGNINDEHTAHHEKDNEKTSHTKHSILIFGNIS